MDHHSRIDLKPVRELLGMTFFIPDYQRGYRWTPQEATDLLNDIWNFAQDKASHTEIYCVQPLVVQKKTEDIHQAIKERFGEDPKTFRASVEQIIQGKWNVVDGQQRLTTIYLILKALGQPDPYVINYQTRQGSEKFLGDIRKEQAIENIDYYHIYNVYQAAIDWLRAHTEVDRQKFIHCLLEEVTFIWYQIPDEIDDVNRTEAISAFQRLNIGKIPLTDSELIKALFLNRSNFGCSQVDLDTQQSSIAMQWDQIEYALQDDAFWLFLHDEHYKKPTRIDFILDMIAGTDENSKDAHQTFRYYHDLFRQNRGHLNIYWLKAQWKAVRDYHQIFCEWYSDYKLYHYIGYLTTVANSKDLIPELVKQWRSGSKDDFFTHIQRRIVAQLRKQCLTNLDEYVYDGQNTLSKRECMPILLLHNIETVIQQNDKLVNDARYALPNFTRFPFHLYKKENWEVEHIRPNAGDNVKDAKVKQLYVLLAKDFLADQNGLHTEIDDYLNAPDDQKFGSLWETIRNADKSLDDDQKNKIWNYTLLDRTTNREYGNAIFPIKRAFLANKEQGYKIEYAITDDAATGKKTLDTSQRKPEIAFVPPCTRNVFAKFYTPTPNGLLEWTESDAKHYLDDIKQKLARYIQAAGGECK